MEIQSLLRKSGTYLHEKEIQLVAKSFEFAQHAHDGQFLRSGKKFIVHPLQTAMILADLHSDATTICVGLLHNIPQYTSQGTVSVKRAFGSEIASMVDEVGALSKIRYYEGMSEEQLDLMRKIALTMTRDSRPLIVKMASRLHLMQSWDYVSEEARHRIALESLEIYAVLAHLLGIWNLRWQLEDISFLYLHPQEYKDIQSQFLALKQIRHQYIQQVTRKTQKELKKLQIRCLLEGRFKHFYSIYKKLHTKQKEFDEIYDVFALRVIVDSVDECYRVLGLIHGLFRPVLGRLKDYIGAPKENGYRSIHTTVYGPENHPVEFQIRTHQMHEEAMYGAAAHWLYKKNVSRLSPLTVWVKEIFHFRKDEAQQEFVWSKRLNILPGRIFVFSPKRDILELPEGSTPLDFAYSVHSNLGHQCMGAIVNHREVTLDYPLKTGDTVNIVRGEYENPNPKWLSIVRTTKAKEYIHDWLALNQEDQEIRQGRLILQKEINRYVGRDLRHALEAILDRFPSFKTAEELYRAIFRQSVTPYMLLSRSYSEMVLLGSHHVLMRFSADKQGFYRHSTALSLRLRGDREIVFKVFAALADFPLTIETVSKTLEHSINRTLLKISLHIGKFQLLHAVCTELEKIPEVESITKL